MSKNLMFFSKGMFFKSEIYAHKLCFHFGNTFFWDFLKLFYSHTLYGHNFWRTCPSLVTDWKKRATLTQKSYMNQYKTSDVTWCNGDSQNECCKFFSKSAQNFHVKKWSWKKNIFQKVRQNGPCSFLLFFFEGLVPKNLMLFSNVIK